MDASTRLKRIVGVVSLGMLLLLLVLLVQREQLLTAGTLVYVDFVRIEGVPSGAEVRLASRRIGRIIAIHSRKQRSSSAPSSRQPASTLEMQRNIPKQSIPSKPKEEVFIRAHVWIDAWATPWVRQNSTFYISSNGFVGEKYLVVETRGERGPIARSETVFRGVDPPRMDRLISKSYESLKLAAELQQELLPALEAFQQALAHLSDSWHAILPDKMEPLRAHVIETLVEGAQLWASFAKPEIDSTSILKNAQLLSERGHELSSKHLSQMQSLISKSRELAPHVSAIHSMFHAKRRDELAKAFQQMKTASDRLSTTLSLVTALSQWLTQGQGTLGRYLSDTELNVDIKTIHGILKETPWRALIKKNKEHDLR